MNAGTRTTASIESGVNRRVESAFHGKFCTSASETRDWCEDLAAIPAFAPHSAYSATLLLMSAVMLSRVIGYLREAYIAWASARDRRQTLMWRVLPFRIGLTTRRRRHGFDYVVSIYTRFLAEDREEDAQKTFSIIITVMTVVLGIGVGLTEIFTRPISAWMFSGFSAEQLISACI